MAEEIIYNDGDNSETVSMRFYNITQATGIPTAGATTILSTQSFGIYLYQK